MNNYYYYKYYMKVKFMKIFLEIHKIIQVLLVILLWFKSTPKYFFKNSIIITNKSKFFFLFLDKIILQ